MSDCKNYVSEEDIKALKESELHIEHVARSRNLVGEKALSVTDPIRGENVTNRTLDGLEKLYTDKIESIGYQQMGDYATGINITGRDQIVFHNGSWYMYRGEIPHVTTGATLPEDGGIWSDTNPDGLWVDIGDVSLRGDLKNGDGSLIGIGNNRTLKDKILESVSVTDFSGCNSSYHPTNNPRHSNVAFKEALDFEWVTYPAADSLARYPKPKSTRVRIPCGSYLITETLPITSGLHLDFDDGVVIYFKPQSKIDLFSPPIDKMKATYANGHTNWNDMTIYGARFTGAAVIKGNMTKDSVNHANHCINGGNFHRCEISRLTIEDFEIGIYLGPLDTTSWTGGRIGNHYNNVIDNVFTRDCKYHIINRANLTTLLNSQLGNEWLRKTDNNAGDYLLESSGSGFTAINSNIASLSRSFNPKIANVYDTCDGSTYTGCYSEYFDTMFLLSPTRVFGGISIDPSHFFKYNKDILIKFKDGYMPSFNLKTRERGGLNLKGPAANAELFTTGMRFSNSNAELITDAFELAPMYDFKYGMYGSYIPSSKKVAIDIKRFESENTGFLSPYGARFIVGDNTTLSIPILNLPYEASVCVLYRVISGDWDGGNIKLNISFSEGNKYITVGEDFFDYGNGWRMASVRNARLDPRKTSGLSLSIEMKAGTQIEIEHIGAYKNGVPIFPTTSNYAPKVNSTSSRFNDGDPFYRQYSGGTFDTGDLLAPYIYTDKGAVVTPSGGFIQNSYVEISGSSKGSYFDATDSEHYVDTSLNMNSGLVMTESANGFQYSIGIGDVILVENEGTSNRVVKRIFNDELNSYSFDLVINNSTYTGKTVISHKRATRNKYTKI